MNLVLWILQAVLAFVFLSGGVYKLLQYDEIAQQMSPLSRSGASVPGVIEILGAVLLIVPAAMKWLPILTPLAAAVLALENLALSGLFAQHSLKLTPTNPLLWTVVLGLLSAVVAYGRFSPSRLT